MGKHQGKYQLDKMHGKADLAVFSFFLLPASQAKIFPLAPRSQLTKYSELFKNNNSNILIIVTPWL
jgi:hypothetical protein